MEKEADIRWSRKDKGIIMATNRKWLETLSGEEYANEWLKIEKMLHGDCGFHIEVITQYLQAEHTTTADEDFAEIGYPIERNGVEFTTYKGEVEDGELRFSISKKGLIFQTKEDAWLTDKEIDQIRTIADKKRKELGWVKEVAE